MEDAELKARITMGESDIIEFKRQFRGVSDAIAEAACAFANDYGNRRKAGLIVIGLNDDKSCANLHVDDQMMRDVTNLLRSGEIQPFPNFMLDKKVVDGCELIAVWVHPSDNTPVRYKGRTCIRLGARKAYATADEEKRLVEKRVSASLPFDARGLSGAELDELDLKRFELEILPQMIDPEMLAANNRDVQSQLRALRLVDKDSRPTPAALLIFGIEPRRWLPGAYIQFLRINGPELSDPIINAEEVGGNIVDQIRRIEDIAKANIQVAVDITSGVRDERPDYPFLALSQLIRNAVMHRSYDAGFQPVRITWYTDRIEILSPGGPYGEVTKENFGTPGVTSYRNPTLSELLKYLNFVERFAIGIPIARSESEKIGCTLEFEPVDNFVLARIWRAK